MSRPARARGLKQEEYERAFQARAVAPRAGAWIETLIARSAALPT